MITYHILALNNQLSLHLHLLTYQHRFVTQDTVMDRMGKDLRVPGGCNRSAKLEDWGARLRNRRRRGRRPQLAVREGDA